MWITDVNFLRGTWSLAKKGGRRKKIPCTDGGREKPRVTPFVLGERKYHCSLEGEGRDTVTSRKGEEEVWAHIFFLRGGGKGCDRKESAGPFLPSGIGERGKGSSSLKKRKRGGEKKEELRFFPGPEEKEEKGGKCRLGETD